MSAVCRHFNVTLSKKEVGVTACKAEVAAAMQAFPGRRPAAVGVGAGVGAGVLLACQAWAVLPTCSLSCR